MPQESDVFCVRDGEILCANGTVVALTRRQSELVQILAGTMGHFQSWQEIARKWFAITDEYKDEMRFIATYACTVRARIDGKCSFGIEGRQGYGYRLFGRLLIDE